MNIRVDRSLNSRLAIIFSPSQLSRFNSVLGMIREDTLPASAYMILPKGVLLIKYEGFRAVCLQKKSFLHIVKVVEASSVRSISKNLGKPLGRGQVLKLCEKKGRKQAGFCKTKLKSGVIHKSVKKSSQDSLDPVWRKKINLVFGDAAGQALAVLLLEKGFNSWVQVMKWFFAK